MFTRYPHFSLPLALLVLGGSLAISWPAQADVPAGTVIKNQATGSFDDPFEPANTSIAVESNEVTITVAEVAGITATSTGLPQEAPGTVTGAGSFQGNNSINTGDVVYFDFLITNTGNDPTQFLMPGQVGIIGGNLQGSVQIIEVDSDGSGSIAPLPSPTTASPIAIPTSGATTTTLLATLANPTGLPNGSLAVGGTVKIRVPVKITASPGSNAVRVTLGDTGGNDNSASTQNQPYSASTSIDRDLYTQDNLDTLGAPEVAGLPINGDNNGHRQEASASQSIDVTRLGSITGTVFEDKNYGGGAGRPFSTPTTTARDGATVELYKKDGTYISNTLTSGGSYTFSNIIAGDYIVRVVNSTVTSARGNVPGLLPIQTFRVDGSTGTPINQPNRVGGEKPNEDDPVANSGSQTLTALNNLVGQEVQSIAPVKVGNTDITGIDFGYNFDTIVNTNDRGQGSLRQFIINSNALSNTGLAQVGQVAGQEVSIFMISDGAAHGGLASGLNNQLSSYGAAVITLATALPNITDSDTVIDGATQTSNVGNTNPGTLGTGGTVGTDAISLPLFQRPEVEINGISIPSGTTVVQTRLIATGAGSRLKNTAANLHLFYGGNGALIQDNLVGMQADGTIVRALDNTAHAVEAGSGSNITVRHNFVRANDSGIRTNGSGTGLLFEFNEVDAPPTSQTNTFEGILLIGAGDGYTVRNNLVKNMRGAGTELSFGGSLTNTLLENNSYIHNGYLTPSGNSPSTENVGIVVHTAGASKITISKNIITGTSGPGIVVMGSRGVTITRNSIYGNGVAGVSGLGIDLDPNDRDPNNYVIPNGVTANNGTVLAALPNNDIDYPIITFATLNNGTLGVKGYVGKNPAGSSTFAGVRVEFFITDNSPANQDGEVILGDGKTKPHGEGKTYIGFCTADANGLFGIATAPCVFSNAGTLGLTNASRITATATDADGNTSEFSPEPITNNPNMILVKRITAINGRTATVGGDNLGVYKDTNSPYDDNDITIPNAPVSSTDLPRDTDKWPTPSTFLLGGTDGGTTQPNSEMDYTIYFLSDGDTEARNVVLCDLIPANQTFVPTAFNSTSQINGGLPGIDRGILVFTNNTTLLYTNVADGDKGRYYAPGEPLPNACKKASADPVPTNTNGAIVVNLGNVRNASTAGSPADSYGFVRFRVRVK
jgi:trimeric autotransporter adhesin